MPYLPHSKLRRQTRAEELIWVLSLRHRYVETVWRQGVGLDRRPGSKIGRCLDDHVAARRTNQPHIFKAFKASLFEKSNMKKLIASVMALGIVIIVLALIFSRQGDTPAAATLRRPVNRQGGLVRWAGSSTDR